MNTTTFGKFDGKGFQVNGIPKRITVFDNYAPDADYIGIEISDGYNFKNVYLTKHADGVWRSPVWMSGDKYMCYELHTKRVNYALEIVRLTEDKGKDMFLEAMENCMVDAEKAINWCDPEDENDSYGRYWLNAYRGAGVYRLVVEAGKIRGAIYGGFHDCDRTIRCACAGDLAFMDALYKVVEKHLGTKAFKMLKADGSGTYFYLRNADDAVYLKTKEYDAPSVMGWRHHNIEVV